jgi:hypothetical protein
MPSYLQKTGHIDGRLPAPEIVAAAADLTRHMRGSQTTHTQRSRRSTRRIFHPHDIATHPRYATRAFIRSTALATCRASGGHQHSATWSPTIPGRVSSPESSSSTGN